MSYLIPKETFWCDGQVVNRGELIVDGAVDPHDILRLRGIEALAVTSSTKCGRVYRLQGVKINDKHIEVIVRQMLRRVHITDSGDTRFITGEQVERAEVLENDAMIAAEGNSRPLTTMCCWVLPRHRCLLTRSSPLHRSRKQPRVDRSCNHGQEGRPAWSEGKRDRWSPDSSRYRFGISLFASQTSERRRWAYPTVRTW